MKHFWNSVHYILPDCRIKKKIIQLSTQSRTNRQLCSCYELKNSSVIPSIRGLGPSKEERWGKETCIIFCLFNTFMFSPIYLHQWCCSSKRENNRILVMAPKDLDNNNRNSDKYQTTIFLVVTSQHSLNRMNWITQNPLGAAVWWSSLWAFDVCWC